MNKHYFLTRLQCFLLICFFSLSMVIRTSHANEVVKGEFFVKSRSGQETRAATILRRAGGQRKKSFSDTVKGLQLWKFNEIDDPKEISALSNNDDIEYIEPNYIIRIGKTPEIPYSSEQWGLERIRLTDAWNAYQSQPNAKIVVAVIDSGVDHNHLDIKPHMWVNPNEIPNNDIDDGKNGYKNGYRDDIYGYDFTNGDSNPFDDHFHGTHCAGIITAITNNSKKTNSSPIKIMALKILDETGYGKTDDAIEAVQYAIDNGAKIINGSWGNAHGKALQDVFQAAQNAGILVVTAAGNDLQNTDINEYYPAGYPLDNIISVAAIGPYNELAIFELGGSNYGRVTVDLGAPGVGISSTVPSLDSQSDFSKCLKTNACYSTHDGTSMAAPHVAGVAALIWSANPELTYQQVKRRILSNVDKVPLLEGKTVTGGILNAYKAFRRGEVQAICTISITGVRATLDAIQYDDLEQEDYIWTIDNGEEKIERRGPTIFEDFDKAGIFPVTLTIKYQNTSKTTNCAVNIPTENIPVIGQVKASMMVSSIDGTAPLPIHFDGTRSIGRPVGDRITVSPFGLVETTRITDYTWSLCKKMPHGDCVNNILDHLKGKKSHFFETLPSGDYKVSLKVADSDGFSNSETIEVKVIEWPLLPPLGEPSLAFDSKARAIRTHTKFAGGISLHNLGDYKTQQTEKHLDFLVVDVKGEIKVDSRDNGQVADIIAVIMVDLPIGTPSWFMLSDNQILPWDNNLSNLAAFQPAVTLEKSTQRLSIIHYEGTLPSGDYYFFFGYRLTNGTVIFTGTPLSLEIKP